MLRVIEDVVERPLLDHPPGIHHDHAIGDVGHDAEVVGDEDHAGSGLVSQLAQLVEDLRLDRDVERGRRLVGDQQLGRARERHRDHHALAHAARELVRVGPQPVGRARDADPLHHLDRAVERLGLGDLVVVDADLLDDLMTDPVHRVQRAHRVLEHHRDPGAADSLQLLGRGLHQLGAVVGRGPLEAGVWSAGQPHQSHRGDGLARTRFADDRHDLAGIDRERDAVHRLHGSVLGRERDSQAVDLEQRCCPVSGGHIASRIRGSRNAYRMSITAARITTANAVSITITRIGMMSSLAIDWAAS